jgi:uncharacterized protein YxeA
MKKIILLLTVITLSFSCSSDSNSNSNNPSNGNVNYYFKIKINGVEHKVQGNTSSSLAGYNPNLCYASVGSTTILAFWIDDITYPNYVSGQNLQLQILIPNCHVGLNQASLTILSSPVWENFFQNSGTNSNFVETSGLYCQSGSGSICPYPSFGTYQNIITIDITDMGTPNGPQGYGNTFKGSYNGPIYFGNFSNNVYNMNIPMQFSMEFEAYRTN